MPRRRFWSVFPVLDARGDRRHRGEPAAALVPRPDARDVARLDAVVLARHRVVGAVRAAAPHRPAVDGVLHPVHAGGVPVDQGHRARRVVRLVAPRRAPHRGAPDGDRRHPAPGARVPDRLVPERRRARAAPRVELGDRRGAAGRDGAAVVHRLPAAVGPAGVLGGHGQHEHRRRRCRSWAAPSASC